MATDYVWKVEKGSKVDLKDYDPDYTHSDLNHADADKELQKLGEEISKLQ